MSVTLPDVKLREIVSGWKNSLRPLSEFFNRKSHDIPHSFKHGTRRLVKNLDYFHSNYLCVVILFLIMQILASPPLLLVIASSVASSIFILRQNIERKAKLLSYEVVLNTRHQLKFVGILSILAFWIVGGTFAIGWVACISVAFILGHGLTHNTDKIDQQQALIEEV